MDKELDSIKKTYPKMKLIEHIEYGRLSNPEKFPYKHQNRLYREVTNKILQSLLDFHYAFKNLPSSYKEEILLSSEFSSFMYNIFSVGQLEKPKKEESKDNLITTELYQKFFNIGLDGLIRTLPQDYSSYLKIEMKPLLLLMLAISKTTKSKYPINLEFPTFVFTDRETNPMSSGF
jgi:hypothetical protein